MYMRVAILLIDDSFTSCLLVRLVSRGIMLVRPIVAPCLLYSVFIPERQRNLLVVSPTSGYPSLYESTLCLLEHGTLN
jgi:hypothetical protein